MGNLLGNLGGAISSCFASLTKVREDRSREPDHNRGHSNPAGVDLESGRPSSADANRISEASCSKSVMNDNANMELWYVKCNELLVKEVLVQKVLSGQVSETSNAPHGNEDTAARKSVSKATDEKNEDENGDNLHAMSVEKLESELLRSQQILAYFLGPRASSDVATSSQTPATTPSAQSKRSSPLIRVLEYFRRPRASSDVATSSPTPARPSVSLSELSSARTSFATCPSTSPRPSFKSSFVSWPSSDTPVRSKSPKSEILPA